MNLEQELKDQAKEAEEHQNFIHDKLIALATAILGFTIVMIGEEKLQRLNLCLLKVSWYLFGAYLGMAIGYLWASLRFKVLRKTRASFIKMDLENLEQLPPSNEKNEKRLVLTLLPMKEMLNKARKKNKSMDAYYKAFEELYHRHKNSFTTTRYLKDQSLDRFDFKDRIMDFFILNADWAYVAFGLGLFFLLISAL